MAIQNIDNYIEALPKERRDWLEVFGNQWAPVKQMPGTCEACVWGRGKHSDDCTLRGMDVVDRLFRKYWRDSAAMQAEVIEKSLNPPFVR